MASTDTDQKKRPPPLHIPPLPLAQRAPVTKPNRSYQTQQQQWGTRDASNSTQQGPRSAGITPLTSPLEHDGPRPPHTGSSKSRTSAMATLSHLVDQARSSPRKSEQGSTVNSQRGSTTRSRHSEHSHKSAAAAQAQLEALDEKTSRGRIESRSERNFFKMTGQVPPTPTTGRTNDENVYIRTEDLRAQCRAINEEKQPHQEETTRSPKKKLFSNIRNPFTKPVNNAPTPPMPSKAAQVFGTSARKHNVIEARPVKPAHRLKTPTRVPRSETSKSLPPRVIHPNSHARRHGSGSAHRPSRGARRSSRSSKRLSDAENTPPVPPVNSSFESISPPTPPAKDTPPELRHMAAPSSPLRRAAPAQDLRESYETYVDKGMKLRLPAFALSPSRSRSSIPNHLDASPEKFRPYTAEDYTNLIGGGALQWSHSDTEYSASPRDSKRDVPSLNRSPEAPRFAPIAGRTDDLEYGTITARRLSTLPPRFYTPSNRSVHLFLEGETPSKNSDVNRLLFTLPSKPNLAHLREDSSNESIEIMFQGDPNDIDPQSSTGQLISSGDHNMRQRRGDQEQPSHIMQALCIDEQQQTSPLKSDTSGYLRPDQSARLTDMLNGVTSLKGNFSEDFVPKCPSAVPSPLHNMPAPVTPMQPAVNGRGSLGPWGPPHTPKNIDDHFFMTNEHLDVMGKTTWDLLENLNQRQQVALNTRQEQCVALVERHVEDIKSQVNTVNEKLDRAAESHNNIHNDLDKVLNLIKTEIAGAFTAQDQKASQMEAHIKDLQNTVQGLQQLMEQKPKDTRTNQQFTAEAFPSLNTGQAAFPPTALRSQPSLADYYGHAAESGRDGQPPMPHMYDSRTMTSPSENHTEARGAYNNGYGQQWGLRPVYPARNSRDTYSNPYSYPGNGSFNNGYAGGNPSNDFSPSHSGQHYTFNPGAAK